MRIEILVPAIEIADRGHQSATADNRKFLRLRLKSPIFSRSITDDPMVNRRIVIVEKRIAHAQRLEDLPLGELP